jgi:hypothetical protein
MSLNLRKLEGEGAVGPTGAKAKHGVQAYLKGGRLPSGRAWRRAQAEIDKLRLDLVRQYGGPLIRPDVAALVESAIEALTVQRLSALYIRKAGLFRRDSLNNGALELHPVLSGQFLAYHNAVRLNLESAARLAGQKPPEPTTLTLEAYVAAKDAEKAQAREAESVSGLDDELEDRGSGEGRVEARPTAKEMKDE